MLNSVINNNATAQIQKQAVQNTKKSGADFLFALNNATQTLTPTSGDITFSKDDSFIIGDGQKIHLEKIKVKEQRPVTAQEVQNELGVSQTEAEKILNEFKLLVPVDYNPKEGDVHIKDLVEGSRALKEMKIREAEAEKLMAEQMSPAGQKKYLMSQKLEAVVRDKAGNIIAKLYKDGSSMNLGYDGGTTPAEKLKKLESDPSVTVTHYSGDFSDFDLIPEEVALAEKDYLKRPELYPAELISERIKGF